MDRKNIQLVVGLGNPGVKYELTRHNLGFLVVDAFLSTRGTDELRGLNWRQAHAGDFLSVGEDMRPHQRRKRLGVEAPYWLKPMTYMNLSGQSVKGCLKDLKLQPQDVMVVYDELDLDVGFCKLKLGGGDGGHNGIGSLIDELSTDQFYRLRLGIGKPMQGRGSDWVLGEMPETDREAAIEVGVHAIAAVLEHGAVKGMQMVNTKVKRENKDG